MKNRNGWSLHALVFALLLGIPLSGVSLAADCGDVNNSEGIDIDDCVYLIAYVFQGGPAPDCGVGPSEIGTVTDIDGNLYYTVKIGEQWWMLENLRVTHYRNGDAIPNVTDDAEWEGLSTGAYCDYDNDPANVATYGRLYNWYAVGDSRNIAPAGWHVPSDDEWQTLVDYLGGSSVAGGKMKEAGTTHWNPPNTGATNESGFSALPGGYRIHYGSFDMGFYTYFWSSTEYSSSYAWYRSLNYINSQVGRDYYDKRLGISVRCVRD